MSRLRDHGLLIVLFLLVALFSTLTWTDRPTTGRSGADSVADLIRNQLRPGATVVVFAAAGPDDHEFAARLQQRLPEDGFVVAGVVAGQPFEGLEWLTSHRKKNGKLDAVAASTQAAGWTFLADLPARFPNWSDVAVVQPISSSWPIFLLPDNLRNILSQIAVIALVAVGMTLVIATGGIDLSVGSLMAFAAVLSAQLIRDYGGGRDASAIAMVLCCLAAIAACAGLGAVSGTLITTFRLPPFIATLGMMRMARGLAFKMSNGRSINEVPDGFSWLGRGASIPGIPNVVVLDAIVYALACLLLYKMVPGRYILAVGSNARAALLSGVPIRKTLIFVYTISAALAGLGGIVLASQLQTGDPKSAPEYELLVITAVVVGGTSLRGGQGLIFGTLLGALLMSVIQVGMNLIHIDQFNQMIVQGAILLLAVLLDRRRPS